jgi:aspartyl-tRNA(Asn)/glutamyl-tRNA(Gln) amidotransferase subunit C
MEVDDTVVKSIAQLAQLELKPEDIQENIDSMASILKLVDQMQSVDTNGIEPMAHPLDAMQSLREDQVSEPNQKELFQSIAPAIENDLYLVPKVIE